jgi:hypothetical protein
MRGGKRENSGRKPGSKQQKSIDIALHEVGNGLTPLEYMLKILRDENQPHEERKWAAEKAAPFMHARLQTTEIKGSGADGALTVNLLVKYVDGNNSGPPTEA